MKVTFVQFAKKAEETNSKGRRPTPTTVDTSREHNEERDDTSTSETFSSSISSLTQSWNEDIFGRDAHPSDVDYWQHQSRRQLFAGGTRMLCADSETNDSDCSLDACQRQLFGSHRRLYSSSASQMSPMSDPTPAAATARNPRGHHRRSCSAPPEEVAASSTLKTLHSNLKALKRQYGNTHPLVAQVWNLVGNVHFREKNHEAAIKAYQHAVKCEPGRHLADAYSNLATVYWTTDKLEESIGLLQKALDVHEYIEIKARQFPAVSLPIASVYYQLGLVYSLQKSFDKAIDALARARKIREKARGGRWHIDVAQTIDAIGRVHLLQLDYQTALQCYEEALRIKQKLVTKGRCTKQAITASLQNIASVHRERNDLEAAIFGYNQVLSTQKKLLRESRTMALRIQIGQTCTTLGDLYRKNNQEIDAICAYREAVVCYEVAGLDDGPEWKALQAKLNK